VTDPVGRSARTVRPPIVAGTFYPNDPDALRALLDRTLSSVEARASHEPAPKAIVAPHAGYIYSGPIAATAYRAIEPRAAEIQRVVLLGPAHRVPLRGMAVPSVDAFATPLGLATIDDAARRHIEVMPGVVVDDHPHADEHSLEVHVPFLQHVLGEGWQLLPIVVGQATPLDVADVLAALWGGHETLVVISTDLSHYHDYRTAAELDRRTAAAIVAGNVEGVSTEDACGAHPLRGLLELSRRAGFAIELLDLRSSGDTAGDRSRVVGYGAFAVA
jgi:AmmeMemoRadiSam system protein B